ncbi:MAG TPA: hypothetical protein VIM69_01935 [Opitutaceae bacterium]
MAPSLHAGFTLHPLDVMTITDMKPDGKKFPVPTKEKPIYYEAINAGFKDWGRPIAGDKEPDMKLMQNTVVRALAKNHYLSADKNHEGSEIIVMTWGTLYGGGGLSAGPPALLRFLAGDKYMDGGDVSEETGFLTVEHVGQRVVPALGQSKLHDYAKSDLYLVLLRAYSTREANNGKIAELWETRIVVPSNGLALDTSLPTMVQLAAPNIGVDMKKEVFTTPEKALHEKIELGDLQVVDDVDVNAAHVTDITDLLKEKAQASSGNSTTKPDEPLHFEQQSKPVK